MWCEGSHQSLYAYHAHDSREVLALLDSREDGLEEADVKKRQSHYCRNVFSEPKPEGLLAKVFRHLSNPLVFVLLLALVVTFALREYLDAVVIAAALVTAVIIGVLQEGKASKAFAELAKSQPHFATVIRDGKQHMIAAEEVTVGDIVVLESGMQVPADMRLIKAKELSINEEALTGEWLAVNKSIEAVAVGTPLSERSSMAWFGTYVATGYGLGVVTAIGDDTEVGKVATLVASVTETQTPLQEEMQKVSRFMLYIVGVLVVVIFLIGLLEGQPLETMLLTSIAVAVASVPEGLPAAVIIILAVGMDALLKRGGLVRNLLAAETLGSTTYVLTDKTGTLTEAKMAVKGLINGSGNYLNLHDFKDSTIVRGIFEIAYVATNSFLDKANGDSVMRGDPLEQAIQVTAGKLKIDTEADKYRSGRLDYLAFDSERRMAVGLAKLGKKERLLCVNGVPELLIASSNKILTGKGEKPLSAKQKEGLLAAINEQTIKGRRLVAVAYRTGEYEEIPESKDLQKGLVLAGIIVLDDPVRAGVKEAITGVKEAGAEVILVTGDNAGTALSVAVEVGIAGEDDNVLSGSDLEGMTDDELLLALDNVSVFARILPEQKMRIASLLQKKGEIVAMTGDGINDTPALRRANIGVAIGSGTEVAKESSDLVLVEDSFATIYAAIEEGRRIISNMRKIVGYLISTSLSEVVLIGSALLLGLPVPILPTQILWANIIEEGFMSVAFAFEKGDKNAMKQRPQDVLTEGIISGEMKWFMAYVVTILGVLTVGLYMYVVSLAVPLEELRSVMFIAISVDSLFLAFAFRSLTVPAWQVSLKSNRFFVGSFVISLALLLMVLEIPFFQYLLHYEPLTYIEFGLIVLFGFASLLVIETGKWLYLKVED